MDATTLGAARARLAFALDYPDLAQALRGLSLVGESVGVAKIGLELFVREGVVAVSEVKRHSFEVFLDLKLHDIPETVERAVANACALGVRYLTLHASGGPKMLEQAVRRVEREGVPLTLLAVTVLTSLDAQDLERLGVGETPEAHALRLARLARDVGVGGCVCSSREVASLRQAVGDTMLLVTPGIRLAAGEADDQKRTGSPAKAIQDGANLLVVGRPIRDAAAPASVARAIVEEIGRVL